MRLAPTLSRTSVRSMSGSVLIEPLSETDPELFKIIEDEKSRQADSLALIASENFTSRSVFDALGSVMSNKYSEGYPGARYYGGIDLDLRWLSQYKRLAMGHVFAVMILTLINEQIVQKAIQACKHLGTSLHFFQTCALSA